MLTWHRRGCERGVPVPGSAARPEPASVQCLSLLAQCHPCRDRSRGWASTGSTEHPVLTPAAALGEALGGSLQYDLVNLVSTRTPRAFSANLLFSSFAKMLLVTSMNLKQMVVANSIIIMQNLCVWLNHRLLWIGRDLYRSSSPTPLQEQGHLQLDQVAQSPIQPDPECFQGWGLHYFSVPVPHHPHLLEGCYKVSPQPSLLQAGQPQLSQPVLIAEVLQPSDHFRGPPLDPLQQVPVFPVLRAPELDAVLQDTVGLLSCECTLLAHVQLFIHQYTHVLLCRAAVDPFITQPKPRIALTQVQDLALGLVEPHEVYRSPVLELVQVPLDGIPSFSVSTTPLSLVSSANLLRVHSISLSVSLMKILNSTGPTVDCYPLDAAIQPIPYPLNSPPIKSTSLQFREKVVVPPVVTNLVFPYSGLGFTPVVPNMSIDSGGKPFLLFFASLAKFSSSCALAFLTPSLHNRAASLYSSQDTCPCFHCLCISFLLFSLTSTSQLSHAASLKICQLCSAPLSLRTISQRVLLTNYLKSWKFAFLKFRVLTILLACPILFRIVNSTRA
ncbi:LOW QUALITY PROTEIN: hypothetical protein QYF61_015422 [Mycteria americana]|uniref:Uncharacterized protein n=1 Tax=Mycteria americana TaxID=33587 RepID=A0AAN7NTE0_MYCAM|nr:LOW QUALITY PROTEIN: hypothetical protein QYF61_015422 [Mycteria americana]